MKFKFGPWNLKITVKIFRNVQEPAPPQPKVDDNANDVSESESESESDEYTNRVADLENLIEDLRFELQQKDLVIQQKDSQLQQKDMVGNKIIAWNSSLEKTIIVERELDNFTCFFLCNGDRLFPNHIFIIVF